MVRFLVVEKREAELLGRESSVSKMCEFTMER
jgi:hypothetical protein